MLEHGLRFLTVLAVIWIFPPLFAGVCYPRQPLAVRWWIGSASIGLIGVTFHALGLSFFLTASFLLILLAAGSFRTFREIRNGRSFNSFKAIAFLSMLPLLMAAYLHILSQPITPYDWDTISLWFKKVKMIYAWFPLKNTPIADWGGAYINYPYLGPMLEALTLKTCGHFLENFGRLIFPAFFAAWIFSFNSLLDPSKNRWLYWLPPFLGYLFFTMKPFTNGYQESLLTCMAGMASIQFCRYWLSESPSQGPNNALLLGCFFTGMLIFVKAEGILLIFILSFSFLTVALWGNFFEALKRILPYFLLTLFLGLLWPGLLLWNQIDMTHLQNKNYTLETFSQFFQHFDRLQIIGPFYLKYFLEKGPVLFSCVLFSLFSFKISPLTRRPLTFLWLVLVGHWIIIIAPYFAAGFNVYWALRNNFDRLMFEHRFIYPALFCVAAGGIADKISQLIHQPKSIT